MDTTSIAITIMGGVIIGVIIGGARLAFVVYALQDRQTIMGRDSAVRFRLLRSKLDYLQSHGRQGQAQDPEEEEGGIKLVPCEDSHPAAGII